MDEQLKQKLLPALVVFNLTVVAWMFYPLYRFFLGEFMSMSQFITQALIGAGIGLVTGGITFAVMAMKK